MTAFADFSSFRRTQRTAACQRIPVTRPENHQCRQWVGCGRWPCGDESQLLPVSNVQEGLLDQQFHWPFAGNPDPVQHPSLCTIANDLSTIWSARGPGGNFRHSCIRC